MISHPGLVWQLDLAHIGRVQDLIFAIQDQIKSDQHEYSKASKRESGGMLEGLSH